MSEQKEPKLLRISNAPHTESSDTIAKIMWTVVAALMPAAVYSVYVFGTHALFLMLTGIASAIAAEAVVQHFLKQPITIKDGSAVLTGLLVAMNVPPDSSLWVTAIGCFFAIFIVKQLFGGLGFNIFNPALAARAFMVASWPNEMLTKWHSFAPEGKKNVLAKGISNVSGLPQQAFDALTSATPLGVLKEGPKILKEMNIPAGEISAKLNGLILSPEMFKSMFVGNIGGVVGETSALLLLLGGIILLIRRVITWHIPVSYIGTMALLCLVYYGVSGHPAVGKITLFHLLGGGLFLGAFFMATDMVTSPVSAKGMLIFGAGCGVLAFVIRIWGGYPEGVSYSILLMNATVPLIDRYIKPRVFGTEKKKTKQEE